MSDAPADRFTEANWDLSRPGRRATPLGRDEATEDGDVDVLVEYTGPAGTTYPATTPTTSSGVTAPK
jgi:hypothetical protein